MFKLIDDYFGTIHTNQDLAAAKERWADEEQWSTSYDVDDRGFWFQPETYVMIVFGAVALFLLVW